MSGIPSLSEQRESLSQVCVLIFEYNVQLATRSVRAFFFLIWFSTPWVAACISGLAILS